MTYLTNSCSEPYFLILVFRPQPPLRQSRLQRPRAIGFPFTLKGFMASPFADFIGHLDGSTSSWYPGCKLTSPPCSSARKSSAIGAVMNRPCVLQLHRQRY